MTPIRVEELGVEPVSLAEMRLYLRLDPDRTDEDDLVAALIVAARQAVEAESRRLLRPARFRLTLTAWPAGGVLPLPLSPLVSVAAAHLVDEAGTLAPIEPGMVRPGPVPWDAPCLLVALQVPLLTRKAALIELVAGCGGDGPPVPAPLAQAIRIRVADAFENRGDAVPHLPSAASALIAPYRLMRL